MKQLSSAFVAEEGGSTDNKRKMPSLSDIDVPLFSFLFYHVITQGLGWDGLPFPFLVRRRCRRISCPRAKLRFAIAARLGAKAGEVRSLCNARVVYTASTQLLPLCAPGLGIAEMEQHYQYLTARNSHNVSGEALRAQIHAVHIFS